MQKTFSKILISVIMISFFVLPFIFSNTTFAQTETWSFYWKSHPPAVVSEGVPEFPFEPDCLIAQGIKEKSGFDIISPCTKVIVVKDTKISKETDTTYTPLAELPGLGTFDSKEPCALGRYLNILVKILIGFSAVLAMVMIVIGGIEYMTSELVSSKKAGIERITNAILGLLIALTAFLILNTINPNLLNVCLDQLPEARVIIIDDFEVSGGLSFNGKPIKINFNKEAYPAAKIASQKTGVDTAFVLAIFGQETSSGKNTGGCTYLNAKMGSGQLEALKKVAAGLNKDYTKIYMSCAAGASTHGGAIGYTQFLPGTWLQYKDKAAALLGHQPDPWNTADALMMTAVYLKDLGGINSEKEAACKYFSGSGNNCGTNIGINTYGNEVMGKKLSIQEQINTGIKNKTLNP